MSIEQIGCCGAYCRTCRAYTQKACRGCKIGYGSGERDIKRAKCKIKLCCLSKEFDSCADCAELDVCEIVNEFYNKNGYKYHKYRQAVMFIRNNGYGKFVKIADTWKNALGRLE